MLLVSLCLLLWSLLAVVSGTGGEVWIIVPGELRANFSNYIAYVESENNIANEVKVFDDQDPDIPRLFSESTSFAKVEKLPSNMISKIIFIGVTNIPMSWSFPELLHFVAIGGQLILAMSDIKSSSSIFFKEFLNQFGISFTKFPIVSNAYESKQWNQELVDAVFEGDVPSALVYPSQTYGLVLDNNRSVNYLWSLITPEPESLILNRLSAVPITTGAMTSLVALFQSKYNGRLCVFPTLHMLSNQYFSNRYCLSFYFK